MPARKGQGRKEQFKSSLKGCKHTKKGSQRIFKKGTADNFPKHLLRRQRLYIAGAALEKTVLKEGSTFSLARMAQQYKKQIFEASFATSQYPSANPPLLSPCIPAE